jgi:hypothetical protein
VVQSRRDVSISSSHAEYSLHAEVASVEYLLQKDARGVRTVQHYLMHEEERSFIADDTSRLGLKETVSRCAKEMSPLLQVHTIGSLFQMRF